MPAGSILENDSSATLIYPRFPWCKWGVMMWGRSGAGGWSASDSERARPSRRVAGVMVMLVVAVLLMSPGASASARDDVRPSAKLDTWQVCFPVLWWRICHTHFDLRLTEYETQVLINSLALGLSVAGAIAVACLVCAPFAGPIAAGLAISAAFVSWVDSLGGNRGVHIWGVYYGSAWLWHN